LTSPGVQRLDKWLWCARIAKSRSLAAGLIEAGSIRVNRQRVVKASTSIKCGDVLTASVHGRIRIIEILSLAVRRGPASEAQSLYFERQLSPDGSTASDMPQGEKDGAVGHRDITG
jgi:ribosome-associated heat shock protein Hsp15